MKESRFQTRLGMRSEITRVLMTMKSGLDSHRPLAYHARMAKGQHLSAYQQGIVRRHYDNLDASVAQKIQELVSDLFLSTSEKQTAKLWKAAATALAKTPAEPQRVERIIQSQDLKLLAELAAELAPGGKLGIR